MTKEEEKQEEIGSVDANEVVADSVIAANDGIVDEDGEQQEDNVERSGEVSSHDSDPDMALQNEKDADTDTDTGTTTSQGVKGWSRLTTVLVLAVVALTATIAVVVPVLVTQNSGGAGTGETTAASKEVTPGKQFEGGSDRQVAPVSSPPFSVAPPSNAPTGSAPTAVEPTEQPFSYPSFYTSLPTSRGYNDAPPVAYDRQACPAELELGCSGRPCAFTGLGDQDFGCCPSWNTYQIWDQNGFDWKNYCYNSFALGEPCIDSYDGDNLCQSNICHEGKCSNARGEVGEPCIESRNCTFGCGKQALNSSSYTCCERYETYIEGLGFYDMYCAESVELGGDCLSDEMCQSYICIENKCAASRLASGSNCSTHSSCNNYACALPDVITSQKICCPSYSYFSHGDYYTDYTEYCANTVSSGERCFTDELCQSGICINETDTEAFCSDQRLPDGSLCYQDHHCTNYACGYTSFEVPVASQNKSCCAGGRSEYVHVDPWNDYVNYCARSISDGESCDPDKSGDILCETGKCVQGICASERLSSGGSCDYDQDCKSLSCGFNSTDNSSPQKICCERASIGFYDGFGRYQSLCSRIVPTGGSCDIGYDGGEAYRYDDDSYGYFSGSELCESGICIQGVCADERLDDGETCNRNTECSSQACAFSLFDFADREKVCCVGNEVHICDNYSCESFCERTVPTGGGCPSIDGSGHRVCQSGICIDGECRDDRLQDGESCEVTNDCDSGACGFDSVDFLTRDRICCASGDVVWLYDRFDYDYYCTRSVPVNGSCISDENSNDDYGYGNGGGGAVCETGICLDDMCASTRLPDSSPCTSNNACDSGACGLNSLDRDKSEKVCCESLCSHQLYDGFSYDSYCVGIQDVGEPCTWSYGRNAENYPQLCSTGMCVDGMCATELIGFNETCSTGTDCTTGACGHASLDMDTEKLCCSWTSSIYDGICGNDDFCGGRIPAGEPCAYRGYLHDSLCQSHYCTSEGICSNETDTDEEWPYHDDHDHDADEEGGHGNEDGEDDHYGHNNTDTYGNGTMNEHSNSTTYMNYTNYTVPGNESIGNNTRRLDRATKTFDPYA